MKRIVLQSIVGAILVIIGFLAGRIVQHAKTGYHFEVRRENEYQSSMGPVKWSYVTESVGMPFLDPGTTVIKFQGRTIYKAQRGFQENYPYAENVKISDKTIEWDDGEMKFHLTIEEIRKQTNSPPLKATASAN